MRNKLLPAQPPPIKDPRRTGRTTAIAMSLVTQALQKQGHKCGAFDHFHPGDSTSSSVLLSRVRDIVDKLGLQYVEAQVEAYCGQYKVTVVSNIWTED
jgi:spore germination cell wall hydrolase CwlJ-like protein